MNQLTFERVDMLYLVWVVPLFVLIIAYGWRRRNDIMRRFADPRAGSASRQQWATPRRRWKAAMVTIAALLVVLALSGPRYGFRWQEIQRRGIDIVIALDCSRSMLAADIQPSRLARAKREIVDLLNLLQGDRIALVAFSGTAFLQCPLTIDYAALHLFLDVLTPDYLPVGGSNLIEALTVAQNAFSSERPADKAIILITDGEHTGPGNPLEAARQLAAADITLFCIGVGSSDGVPLPKAGGGFQKDASGEIVLSKLDEPVLSAMALATGGSYARSVAGDMDLDAIYTQQIRAKLDRAMLESGRKKVWADRYQWPLAAAVALLLATLWLPTEPLRTTMLVLVLVILPAARPAMAGALQEGFEAYQQGDFEKARDQFVRGQLKDPENPEILYNLGNAYYKTGDYPSAWDHYAAALATASPGLKPQLLYNMGNSAYRQGNLEAAIEHYQRALDLQPDDVQARENLEFVKRQRKQRQQNQGSDRQTGAGQDDAQDQNATGSDQSKAPSQARNEPPQGMSRDHSEHNDSKAGNRPEPQPQGADAPQAGSQTAQPEGQQPQPDPPSRRAATQMLNRLKDQPGRALMPNYQKHEVNKDW